MRILLTLADDTKLWVVELPADIPIFRLAPVLMTKLELPTARNYLIRHKESGRVLPGNETLQSADVSQDDVLVICEYNEPPNDQGVKVEQSDLNPIPLPTIEIQDLPAPGHSIRKVRVTVVDSAGGKTVTAELPATAPISRLLPALVTKMNLPSNITYGMQHWESGKQLTSSDTLSSAGVKEGNTLRLVPNVSAGGRPEDFINILPGNPVVPAFQECYRCETGPHYVRPEDVALRDASGNAICTLHRTVMILQKPPRGQP